MTQNRRQYWEPKALAATGKSPQPVRSTNPELIGKTRKPQFIGTGLLLILVLLSSWGCAGRLIQPLLVSMNSQTDLDLICEGGPAYLLIIDSLIDKSPDNPELLISAIKAYSAYTAVLPECGRPERTIQISDKTYRYARRLLTDQLNLHTDQDFQEFSTRVAKIGPNKLEQLFWAGYGWATWIRFHSGTVEAITELPRVERIMQRILELDETYYHGSAHLFLGIIEGGKPALLGGKPEDSRAHFERALAINGRRYLPALVSYAEFYAKTTLNRELFETLLTEITEFPIESAPDIAAANLIAQKKGQRLLDQIEDIF
ncbi:MAG: TRAP transporter TatT component family protein [Proteobacteria bacterium]|nr:TRAP transporter TatT component family protein [Pseudomonadota bacterium]MBU1688973.1 TRAP transporter TatT component family protein [Pseudomonadota bacterium]